MQAPREHALLGRSRRCNSSRAHNLLRALRRPLRALLGVLGRLVHFRQSQQVPNSQVGTPS
eukprot:5821941-Alexandrium_andersonii.AAC.1